MLFRAPRFHSTHFHSTRRFLSFAPFRPQPLKVEEKTSILANFNFSKVMSLFKHYKASITQLVENMVEVNKLRDRSIAASEPESSRNTSIASQSRLNFTRKEHVFIYQTQKDRNKIPVFVLMALFLPEAIPAVLIKFPSLLPEICLTADQTRREKKWVSCLNECKALCEKDTRIAGLANDQILGPLFKLQDLDRAMLTPLANIGTICTTESMRRKIKTTMEFIRLDDRYLDEKNIGLLTDVEVQTAVETRGIPSENYTKEERLNALRVWLKMSEEIKDNGVLLYTIISQIQSKNELV